MCKKRSSINCLYAPFKSDYDQYIIKLFSILTNLQKIFHY